MKIENIKVYNIKDALRGMRFPLKSEHLADTIDDNHIGEKDYELALKLIKSGSSHRKFLRQIPVSMDISAPREWWSQMDTYKIGTTTDSESTMHTIHKQDISISNFGVDNDLLDLEIPLDDDGDDYIVFGDKFSDTVEFLELLREVYNRTKYPPYWKALITILPQSYIQKRLWTANYEVLLKIYEERRAHKLDEWAAFCYFIRQAELPMFNDIIDTLITKENKE